MNQKTLEPYISVVIPAYREENSIGNTLETVNTYLKNNYDSYEIIVVDDASPDNTYESLNLLKPNYPNLKTYKLDRNTKKGGAVQRGILEANGTFVLFTDADLSTSIEQTGKLLHYVKNENYDIAIGSRELPQSKLIQRQSQFREYMAKLYSLLSKVLLVYGVEDTQCGFKIFKKSVGHAIFSNLTSLTPAFDIEVMLISSKFGYVVAEVPVEWKHNPDTRLKYNLVNSIKVFLELIRMKLHWKVVLPLKVKKTHGNATLL